MALAKTLTIAGTDVSGGAGIAADLKLSGTRNLRLQCFNHCRLNGTIYLVSPSEPDSNRRC